MILIDADVQDLFGAVTVATVVFWLSSCREGLGPGVSESTLFWLPVLGVLPCPALSSYLFLCVEPGRLISWEQLRTELR